MRRVCATLLLLVLTTPGALGQKIKSDYDPEFDFEPLRTYAWHPDLAQPRSFPIIDSATLDRLIRDNVEQQLAARGLSKAEKAPDLLVSYEVTGRLTTDLQHADSGPGIPGWPEGRWRPFFDGTVDVQPRREGALTLSVYDAKENRIIWQARGSDVVKNPRDIEKKINRGVKKMLRSFPPKR